MLLFLRQRTILTLVSTLIFVGCENNPDNNNNSTDYDAFAITATKNSSGDFDIVARDFDSFSEVFISRMSGSPEKLTLSLNTDSETLGYESFIFVAEDSSEIMHVNYDQRVPVSPQKIADISPGFIACELSSFAASDRLVNNSGSFEEMLLHDSRILLKTTEDGNDCSSSPTFSNSIEFTANDNVITDVRVTPTEAQRYSFIDTRFVNSTFEELNDEGETVTRERVGQAFSIVKPDSQMIIQLLDEEDDQLWSTSLPSAITEVSAYQISNSEVLWLADNDLYISPVDDLVNGFSASDPTIGQNSIASQIFTQSIYELESSPEEFQLVSSNSATFIIDGSKVVFITNDGTTETVANFASASEITMSLVSGNTAVIGVSTSTGAGGENSTLLYSASRTDQNWLLESLLPSIDNQEIKVSNADGETYISLCNTSTNQFESYFFSTIESQVQHYENTIILNAPNIESSVTDSDTYVLSGEVEPFSSTCTLSNFTVYEFDRDTETGYTNSDQNLGFGAYSGGIDALPTNTIRNSDGILFDASLSSLNPDDVGAFLFDATLSYSSPGTANLAEQRQQLKVARPE